MVANSEQDSFMHIPVYMKTVPRVVKANYFHCTARIHFYNVFMVNIKIINQGKMLHAEP